MFKTNEVVSSVKEARQTWYIYLIRCSDETLYTGISTDVNRRLIEHQTDRVRGARYLRGRGPLRLVFHRKIGDRSVALRLEIKIKRLNRAAKEQLITQTDYFDRILQGIVGEPA